MSETNSKYNMNPAEWEFEFQQRDMHPAVMTDLWLRATRDKLAEQFRLPVENPDYLFTASYKGYIRSANKKDILNKLKIEIKNRDYLNYILTRTMEVMAEFDAVMEQTVAIVNGKYAKEDLATGWRNVEQAYLNTIPWYWIPWYLTEENLISDRVKNGLEKYRSEIEKIIDFNTALGILIFPTKDIIFQKEQEAFCDLVRIAVSSPSFKTDPGFRQRADIYLKEYAWMKTFFLLPVEPLSFDGLLARIDKVIGSNMLVEHDLQQKKKSEYAEVAKKLKKIFGSDTALMQAIADAQELAWVLSASVENGVHAAAKLLPFNKILAENLGVAYADWIHLTSDEIVSILKGEATISQIKIEQRKIGTAGLMQKGNIQWMWGDEALVFSKY
ncbi:MAG: hypothetical protein RL641_631, partial [Candidatus Parcubacteria bacterium]